MFRTIHPKKKAIPGLNTFLSAVSTSISRPNKPDITDFKNLHITHSSIKFAYPVWMVAVEKFFYAAELFTAALQP